MIKFKSQALHIIKIKYWKVSWSGNPPSLIPTLWKIAILGLKTGLWQWYTGISVYKYSFLCKWVVLIIILTFKVRNFKLNISNSKIHKHAISEIFWLHCQMSAAHPQVGRQCDLSSCAMSSNFNSRDRNNF